MADRDCACGCLAVRLAPVCGLSLQPIGRTSALACDVQCYCSCSCCLRRYISVMPLPFEVDSAVDRQTVVIMHESNVGEFHDKIVSALVPENEKVAATDVTMNLASVLLL